MKKKPAKKPKKPLEYPKDYYGPEFIRNYRINDVVTHCDWSPYCFRRVEIRFAVGDLFQPNSTCMAHFRLPYIKDTPNGPAILGQGWMALAWMLDHQIGGVKPEGQLVRLRLRKHINSPWPEIVAVGNILLERWLEKETYPQLCYPFA
jgi:hypothetical protein